MTGRLPLLAIALAAAAFAPPPQHEVVLVRQWIDAVRAHRPGVVDQPLLDIAKLDPHDFDLIHRRVKPVLRDTFPQAELRNDTLRRAALFHMDIAMLMPEQAAAFTQDAVTPKVDPYTGRPEIRQEADTVFYSSDGEYVAAARDSAHWWLASELLKNIQPHPGSDPFVAAWHRAVIAHFERLRLFGSAFYAVNRGLDALPRDPWILLYAGALHDANASAAVQSVPATRPNMASELKTPAADKEWRRAAQYFRDSLAAGGPPEAQVRLARVLGHLGNHGEATLLLRAVLAKLDAPERQYLAQLFLGSEEAALGQIDAARNALEQAARLFPTAQTPLVVLSGVNWQAGARAAALDAIDRIARLPGDAGERTDPWWRYYYSFADDADDQIAAVRAMVDAKGRP